MAMRGRFINFKNKNLTTRSRKLRNIYIAESYSYQPIEIQNWGSSPYQFKAYEAFTALKSDGSVVAWGKNSRGGKAPDLNHINKIYSNKYGFAAIDVFGNTYGWKSEYNSSNWTLPTKINEKGGNISVFSTEQAFANLNEDGSVQTWGEPPGTYKSGANSTSVASELNGGIETIISNSHVFLAKKKGGEIVAWGEPTYGADISVAEGNLGNEKQIVGSYSALSAIRDDDSLISWGNSNYGGDNTKNRTPDKDLVDIRTAVSNLFGFAAITKEGSVIAWGDAEISKVPDELQEIQNPEQKVEKIFANQTTFAALRQDGTVVTWGQDTKGGDSSNVELELTDVETIVSSESAYAALKRDGSVATWGAESVVDNFNKAETNNEVKVKEITAAGAAFAALKEDGSVVTWGLNSRGGDASNVEEALQSGVKKVYSNYYAFAALKEDGTVITWGDNNYGGINNSGKELKDIVSIQTIEEDYSAIQLLNDGKHLLSSIDIDLSKSEAEAFKDVKAIKIEGSSNAGAIGSGRGEVFIGSRGSNTFVGSRGGDTYVISEVRSDAEPDIFVDVFEETSRRQNRKQSTVVIPQNLIDDYGEPTVEEITLENGNKAIEIKTDAIDGYRINTLLISDSLQEGDIIGGGAQERSPVIIGTENDDQTLDLVTDNNGLATLFVGRTGIDNQIYGLGGDDKLATSGGRDSLYGGAGNDQFIISSETALIDGGEGNDVLVNQENSTDLQSVDMGKGEDHVVNYGSLSIRQSLDLGAGDDRAEIDENFSAAMVDGGDGYDTLILKGSLGPNKKSKTTEGFKFKNVEELQINGGEWLMEGNLTQSILNINDGLIRFDASKHKPVGVKSIKTTADPSVSQQIEFDIDNIPFREQGKYALMRSTKTSDFQGLIPLITLRSDGQSLSLNSELNDVDMQLSLEANKRNLFLISETI